MLHSSPDRRLSSITNNQRGSSGNAADIVQSFIGLAGITDITQITAVNTLYNDLVSAGLWNKIQLLYPFIGGNQTAHSINLKDPSQYPLGFVGSVIHNANGVTGTASQNASFSTAYSMALLGNVNDFSFGLYGRTPSGGGTGAVGNYGFATDNFTSPFTYLFFRADGGGTSTIRLASATATNSGFLNSTNARFIAVTSDSNTTGFTFSNQFVVTQAIAKGSNLGTTQIAAQLSNTSVANAMSYSIWYVGLAMTEAELINLNAIFQKYNDTLDAAFGSTRGNNYYINPAYDRIVNRYVSNIQLPAIGTFTTLELDALNYLVTALQTSVNNLWGQMGLLLPFVGSTLAARCRNLATLGSTAVTPNGTSFNFNTSVGIEGTTISSYLSSGTLNSNQYGVYITENLASVNLDLGHSVGRLSLNSRNNSNQMSATVNGGTVTVANSDSKGLYNIVIYSPTAAVGTTFDFYKNTTLAGTGTLTSGGTSGSTFLLGGTSTVSGRAVGVLYICSPINSTAISELYSILTIYLQMLGRI
jgi:hypothetical protein